MTSAVTLFFQTILVTFNCPKLVNLSEVMIQNVVLAKNHTTTALLVTFLFYSKLVISNLPIVTIDTKANYLSCFNTIKGIDRLRTLIETSEFSLQLTCIFPNCQTKLASFLHVSFYSQVQTSFAKFLDILARKCLELPRYLEDKKSNAVPIFDL